MFSGISCFDRGKIVTSKVSGNQTLSGRAAGFWVPLVPASGSTLNRGFARDQRAPSSNHRANLPPGRQLATSRHGPCHSGLWRTPFCAADRLVTANGGGFLVNFLRKPPNLKSGDAFELTDGRLIEIAAASRGCVDHQAANVTSLPLAYRQPPHALPDGAFTGCDPRRSGVGQHAARAGCQDGRHPRSNPLPPKAGHGTQI